MKTVVGNSVFSLGLSLATVFASAVASAKPILWFHFDEKESGSACVSSDAIVNSADIDGAAELNGTAYGLHWNSTATFADGAYFVTYTNALDATRTWIDPQTGNKGDTRGIFVHTPDETEGIDTGTGKSGVILVPDNEKLHLNRFTAEFFVKKNEIRYPTQVLPLQLYNTPSNTFAWQIRFDSFTNTYDRLDSSKMIHMVASRADGTLLFSKGYKPKYCIYDGKWHHIAMTYDGTTCRLYSDYILIGSVEATLEYAANVKDAVLSVGNSQRSEWGRFHGWMDELRISDEVLEPRDFLRSIPVQCDKDTLVYVPFDRLSTGRGDFGYFGMTNNLNEVFPLSAVRFPTDDAISTYFETRLKSPEALVMTNAVPASEMRTGIFDTNAYANAHSLYVSTNSYYLTAFDHTSDEQHDVFTNDAYTIEWFFRQKSGDSVENTFFCAHMSYTGGDGSNKTDMCVINTDNNGELAAYVTTTNAFNANHKHPNVGAYGTCVHPAWGEKSIGTITDDKWHHLAFVGRRPEKTCRLYLDYQPVITFTNTVVLTSKYAGSYVKGITFGGTYNSAKFRGYLDEVRVTRRALVPSEFLSMHGASELKPVNGKNVLLYAPFDEDLSAYPLKSAFGSYVLANAALGSDLPRDELPSRALAGLGTANVKSLVGSSGNYRLTSPVALHGLGDFTVEWYARLENPSTSHPMVRCEGMYPTVNERQWPTARSYGVVWQIAGGGNAPDSLYFAVKKPSLKAGETLYWDAPKYRQNRWHHFAMTCQRVVVGGEKKLECHLYVDHKEAKRSWSETPYLDLPEMPLATKELLYIGSASWCDFTGAIDEVRITEGVLTLDEMLPPVQRGALIIIR